MTTTCLRMRSASTRVAFSVAGLLLPILRRGGRDAADRGSLVSAAEALAEVLDLVPELAGPARTVAELPGGLTNANYKVTTGAGAFVVRCWADDTGLLAIDRDNEYENSVRAAEVGVGAPVIAYLPEHNTMVVGFIEGTTMSAATLRARRPSSARSPRPAGACTDARPSATTSTCSRPSRAISRSSRPVASACPSATWSSRRTPRPSATPSARARRRPCRATTTCWPRTSSSRPTDSG